MKLRLTKGLRAAVMAAMAATSSLALADTTLMVEGVDADDPMNSPRFYDTGKGYYFSWADNSLYLQDFKKLYRNKGSLRVGIIKK